MSLLALFLRYPCSLDVAPIVGLQIPRDPASTRSNTYNQANNGYDNYRCPDPSVLPISEIMLHAPDPDG